MAKMIDMFRFSGKVGNVVGCVAPTGFYIRSAPRKSYKKPTAKQLETRARMALVSSFLSPLSEIIGSGWRKQRDGAYKTQAQNRATAYAFQHAVEGTYPDLHINPAKVRLSEGLQATFSEDPEMRIHQAVVHLQWEPDADRQSRYEDDIITLWLYNPIEKSLYQGKAQRVAGQMQVDVSLEIPGSVLWAYLVVSDRDERFFSNSQCLGSITIEHMV